MLGILVRPIILVAQPPQNDGRVVVVLVDHVRQHALRILLKGLAADPRATPRNLFPHHQAKFVAQFEHQPVLLVVGEPDKIRAHIADHPHLFTHLVVAHCCGHAGVVGMPLRAPEQHPLAIQFEGPCSTNSVLADAEALVEAGLAGRGGQGYPAAIELWRLRRPEFGDQNAKCRELRDTVSRAAPFCVALWTIRPAASRTSVEMVQARVRLVGCRAALLLKSARLPSAATVGQDVYGIRATAGRYTRLTWR